PDGKKRLHRTRWWRRPATILKVLITDESWNDHARETQGRGFDMADAKELQEAAEAIRAIRCVARDAATQRIRMSPLRQAEEWARREYCKVRERNGHRDAGNCTNDPHL